MKEVPGLRGIHAGIKTRCLNSKSKDFNAYGGRGIKIADAWLDFATFKADIESAIGPRPSAQHSIDRIENNGDYRPGNVRWSTRKEQLRNTRSNRLVTANGLTLCVAEWAERTGLSSGTIFCRLEKLGWDEERAVMMPVQGVTAPPKRSRTPRAQRLTAPNLSTKEFAIRLAITEEDGSPLLTDSGIEKALRALLCGKNETDDGAMIIPPLRFEVSVGASTP